MVRELAFERFLVLHTVTQYFINYRLCSYTRGSVLTNYFILEKIRILAIIWDIFHTKQWKDEQMRVPLNSCIKKHFFNSDETPQLMPLAIPCIITPFFSGIYIQIWIHYCFYNFIQNDFWLINRLLMSANASVRLNRGLRYHNSGLSSEFVCCDMFFFMWNGSLGPCFVRAVIRNGRGDLRLWRRFISDFWIELVRSYIESST